MNVVSFTDKLLDVVADFVCDDIGVGEITATTEIAIHLVEESGVNVDFFFTRDVKWSHA